MIYENNYRRENNYRFILDVLKGPEYASNDLKLEIPVLNMSGKHRVLNMPEYAWIIPGYVWFYLNMPKFVWIAFVLHSPIAIPYLKAP